MKLIGGQDPTGKPDVVPRPGVRERWRQRKQRQSLPPQPEPVVMSSALPHEVAAQSREELSGELTSYGLDSFPLTGYQPTRVRLGVVATPAQFRAFADARLVEGGWWLQQDGKAKPLNHPQCWDKIETRRLMQFFRPIVPPGGGRAIKGTAAVDIDLWDLQPDGRIATYTSNPVTNNVGTDEERAALVVDGPLADELVDPIDVVFTWVTHADQKWEADLAAVRESWRDRPDVMPNALTQGRFQDSGELRYALRTVEANMPWVRRVFVVSGNEKPDWLVEGPRLRFVKHDEIMPAESLPTFNSHAIESSLHNIDGLSEHFVYLNDDMFVCNPVASTRFFGPAGQQVVYLSRKAIGLPDKPVPTTPAMAANNARRLLAERHGRQVDRTLLHVPYPMRRSAMASLWEWAPEALRTTQFAQVRSLTDVPPVFLSQWDALLRGAASVGTAKYRTVDAGAPDAEFLMRQLIEVRALPDFLSLNQRDDGSPEGLDAMGQTMKWLFPFPGGFERER